MPEVPSPDWLNWEFWAQNSAAVRDLLITIAALVGVPFVAWREWLHHRQTQAALQQAVTALRRHEAQVEADRERRITENFTRAVEQLGSDKLETRLGAIYALERIARESRDDHWPIMETLTAYVRERVPGHRSRENRPQPATDVQAILTVIGRRHHEYDRPTQRLNLVETDLRGSDLKKAHLEHALLVGAHLERACLYQSHLQAAVLAGAHLEGADLNRAYLKGADLFATDLTQEQFDSAITDEHTRVPGHINRAAAREVAAGEKTVTANPKGTESD